MANGDWIDDPTDLFAPVEAAWDRYVAAGEATLKEVEAQIVETRHATYEDGQFTPDHPLWDRYLTDVYGESWRPRPLRWVPKGEETFPHGLNADGRIVKAGLLGGGGVAIVYQEGFYDRLTFRNPGRSDERLPYEPFFRDGFPTGRVQRMRLDEHGRIASAIEVNQEGPELERHYREITRFTYDDVGRLTESYTQLFNYGTELPHYLADLPPDVAAGLYRQASERLRESLASRKRVALTYGDDGRLIKAEEFNDEGESKEVLYTYNPDDTIEGLVAEFSTLLGKQLVKAIDGFLKANPDAKPAARCALIYSAEHAHCGLPTGVALASEAEAGAERFEPFDWESYSRQVPWPPEGRTGKKLADLHRRLLLVVETDPAYAEDFQPRPYREVLWKAGRAAWETLTKKRATTADFALFPLDDHGDVDGPDDARETLPAEITAGLEAR
ncbi:hypothetical protein [Alienimonas chondri]|uniref:Uncharacterized protein n=1 Tax=Alienimonas chondri TaxID=2681879 RepID=A0ABX1VKC0_9PLAN|nr:hypothetical protein [Alienimonas chondri]NNJ28144.1 hypothetical protein [Alienimonas chondri]